MCWCSATSTLLPSTSVSRAPAQVYLVLRHECNPCSGPGARRAQAQLHPVLTPSVARAPAPADLMLAPKCHSCSGTSDTRAWAPVPRVPCHQPTPVEPQRGCCSGTPVIVPRHTPTHAEAQVLAVLRHKSPMPRRQCASRYGARVACAPTPANLCTGTSETGAWCLGTSVACAQAPV